MYILTHFEITFGFLYNEFEAKTVNLPRRGFWWRADQYSILVLYILHKIVKRALDKCNIYLFISNSIKDLELN